MSTTISGTSGVTFPDSTSMQTGQQACKAWVNFDGTGTVAIRESYNVSSITDNGSGDYTANFTTAMSDANYSITHWATQQTAGSNGYGYGILSSGTSTIPNITTSSFRFKTGYFGGLQVEDLPYVGISFFR